MACRSCKLSCSKVQITTTALILACFLSFSSFPAFISVSGLLKSSESRKTVLGSQPPRCINRCMNCKPCMAVLVVPPRKLTPQEEENYYLVSWKCRCKNKLFQP